MSVPIVAARYCRLWNTRARIGVACVSLVYPQSWLDLGCDAFLSKVRRFSDRFALRPGRKGRQGFVQEIKPVKKETRQSCNVQPCSGSLVGFLSQSAENGMSKQEILHTRGYWWQRCKLQVVWNLEKVQRPNTTRQSRVSANSAEVLRMV